jgi:HTH-type transcriptional regulator/antitoxin MqsA
VERSDTHQLSEHGDGTALKHEKQGMKFSYRDRELIVPAVAGWHFPVCGECEFDAGEGKRYSLAVDNFSSMVDLEIAHEIRAIRKTLGLRQSDAG